MRDNHDVGRTPHDEPLAYLLTWTTYGTWLPGDDRGWVEHPGNFHLGDVETQMISLLRMAADAIILNPSQRRIVEETIHEHCRIRNWHLHAVNCRSNHVHAVVTSPLNPRSVRDQFKALCTRKLKVDQRRQSAIELSQIRTQWWTERGSARYINDFASL